MNIIASEKTHIRTIKHKGQIFPTLTWPYIEYIVIGMETITEIRYIVSKMLLFSDTKDIMIHIN